MLWPKTVRHLALVGHPKSGKTTIAEMLVEEFEGMMIDDGEPLRRALPILTGIPPQAPYSQAGKASIHRVGSRDEVVREGLGELGNWLEARYGEEILAELAIAHAERTYPYRDLVPFFIYPSVRKTQGRAYRRAGGIVIQVDNPEVGPSGNKFDLWDPSAIDFTITNDPQQMDLDGLRDYVRRIPELISAL